MGNDHRLDEPEGHDAQRELEHRALRNVRGLVDRMQADEEARRRSQMWIVAGLAVIALVLIGAVLLWTSERKAGEVREIPLAPVVKAPPRFDGGRNHE